MHFTGKNKNASLRYCFGGASFMEGEKGVFREDGNEMMESQQSTCYTDLKGKKPSNLKRKKEFSQLNTGRGKRLRGTLSKGTFTV